MESSINTSSSSSWPLCALDFEWFWGFLVSVLAFDWEEYNSITCLDSKSQPPLDSTLFRHPCLFWLFASCTSPSPPASLKCKSFSFPLLMYPVALGGGTSLLHKAALRSPPENACSHQTLLCRDGAALPHVYTAVCIPQATPCLKVGATSLPYSSCQNKSNVSIALQWHCTAFEAKALLHDPYGLPRTNETVPTQGERWTPQNCSLGCWGPPRHSEQSTMLTGSQPLHASKEQRQLELCEASWCKSGKSLVEAGAHKAGSHLCQSWQKDDKNILKTYKNCTVRTMPFLLTACLLWHLDDAVLLSSRPVLSWSLRPSASTEDFCHEKQSPRVPFLLPEMTCIA